MKYIILALTIILSSIQATFAEVNQQVDFERVINVFGLNYEYGPYSSEYGNGNGDAPTSSDFLAEYSLETERIFNRNFVERPTQKDISNFVEQLDKKLSSGETLRNYSSYSLDKILNVVRANNEREEANLKEDLNTLKNEIENELNSSIETSKDFADIHNQEVKDYVAALPFLEQAIREKNFKNSSPKVKETAFYSNYVAQTIKAEDQFLKDAADRVIQRADKSAQAGQQEASEKALAQANHLLDNALSPNLVPAKEWRSNGEAKEIINDFHKKISKVRPSSSDQALAKDVALAALDEADEASANEDHELFERNLELAKAGLDIALGFIPVANIGQSLYEAITGRSVITGEELGTFGQAMAIIAVVTLGTSKMLESSLKTIAKIGEAALKSTSKASKFEKAVSLSSIIIESSAKLGEDTSAEVNALAKAIKEPGLTANEIVKKFGISSNSKIVKAPELINPKTIKAKDVIDRWDNYLGHNQTNINPFNGKVELGRIFSADGKRSIRFTSHEIDSAGTPKYHYHEESWVYDDATDTLTLNNTLQRIQYE